MANISAKTVNMLDPKNVTNGDGDNVIIDRWLQPHSLPLKCIAAKKKKVLVLSTLRYSPSIAGYSHMYRQIYLSNLI